MIYATPRASVRKWHRSSGQLILDRSFTHFLGVALALGALEADSFVTLRETKSVSRSSFLHSSAAPLRRSRNGPSPLAHGGAGGVAGHRPARL
jgi:hypothetical protein